MALATTGISADADRERGCVPESWGTAGFIDRAGAAIERRTRGQFARRLVGNPFEDHRLAADLEECIGQPLMSARRRPTSACV